MTSTSPGLETERAALAAVLEAYGADLARWPQDKRLRFATLLASDPEAQRMRREAEALDRLLAQAPAASRPAEGPGLDALTERILAAAQSSAAPGAAKSIGTEIRDIRERERRRVATADRKSRPLPWASLSLMAASLAAGIFIGAAGMADKALEPWAGRPLVADADELEFIDETEVAFGAAEGGGIEEDVW